ncbi:hypothetical protein MDG893_03685 [Marinobacter algicola DG893]|uniref:Uncharacterized protein n=1 Tax=Marinobacter algicola DG893 TaxID=443152 RepID=A6EZE5_9GAMM|nr:hypothetical protein MDG893_03685 [Marinobacter algicola DG893]
MCIDGIKVNRCQHQRREAAPANDAVNGFPCIGEQDVGAIGTQHLAKLRAFNTFYQEHASLLNLDDVGHFLIDFRGHSQRQNHFVLVIADLVVGGVQIQIDLGFPLVLKNRRGIRRLERQILHIDTLERKLGLILVFVACCGLLIFSHVQSFHFR